MTEQKQSEKKCTNCIHYAACMINSEYVPTPCRVYDDKSNYCKQTEGEWIAKTSYGGYGYYCSVCDCVFNGENAEWIAKEHHYCPNCGAKMKGGAK